MKSFSKVPKKSIDISSNGFAEKSTDVITGYRLLFSKKSFLIDDVISDFHWTNIYDNPNYLTVQIGENQHIELLPTHLECANHSCDPNAFFDITIKQLVCIKPIKEGEEITFFYPSAEWDMDRPFDCSCKSLFCVGRIEGAKYLTKEQLTRYRFTDFIQQKLAEDKR